MDKLLRMRGGKNVAVILLEEAKRLTVYGLPLMLIDDKVLDDLLAQAKASPRLRMNYNFHKSLDDKCHRMLNALEPGTDIPIHRHPQKAETFVILQGKVRVTTHKDDGSVMENVVLDPLKGLYGVNIDENVWHTIAALEHSVIFECKAGPFIPHEIEGLLKVENL